MTARLVTFSEEVFKGMFLVSAGAFAVRIIGFLVSIFLLRVFSLRDYGTYQLVLAAGSLFGLLMLQGIDEVIVAAGTAVVGKGDVAHSRDLLRGYWLFKCATGVLAWSLVMFVSPLFDRWYSVDIMASLRLYAWTFLIIPFEGTIRFYFSMHKRFAALSAYSFVQELLKGICVFLLIGIWHMGVQGALLAMVVAMAATAAFFCPRLFIEMTSGRTNVSWGPFLGLLRGQGPWVISQRLLRQGEKNIRPFIIQVMVGREAVALFSLANKVYGYIVGALPLDDVLMPNIASESGNRDRLQRILERGIKYTVPFYGFVATGVALVSPTVIGQFFPQYAMNLSPLYAVLFYVPFVGIAYILTSFFVAHQEQAALFRIMCMRFVLFLILLPVCLWLFGVAGIGIEYFLTLSIYNVMRWVSLQRKYPELHVELVRLFRIDSYDRAMFQRLLHRFQHFNKPS